MKRIYLALLAVAIGAFALTPLAPPPKPAQAAFGQFLCSGEPAESVPGPRTVGGANSLVPSGTLYVLNAQGCAFIAQQDVGAFLSLGFSGGQNFFTTSQTGITANLTTSTATMFLPAGTYIHNIVVQNTTANAITGGVAVGSTANGADIVAAATCGANCLISVADASLLKRIFSVTAAQQVFISCVTSCNSGSLNVSVLYSYF